MPHTPGPWKKVNNCTVRGPHGEPVASTKGFAWPEDANHDANATLIEAAPELMEAAKLALRRFSDLNNQVSENVWAGNYAAAKALREAIAKAEGRP